MYHCSIPENYDHEEDGIYYKQCPDCEGDMQWCSSCEVWSRNCCQEYGDCMCS